MNETDEVLIEKLKSLSTKLQEQIKGINKCFEEAQPIAKQLGYRFCEKTGELTEIPKY